MSDKPVLSDEQRQCNKEIRSEVGTYLQMEHKNNAWLVHVDVDGIATRYGVQAPNHIVSRQDGIDLFNQLCESQGTLSMEHPEGYMPLQNNVYAYVHQRYQDVYENTMDGIVDGLLDGTGCGVQAVLDKLDSTIRADFYEILPTRQDYGDLRYTALTNECKGAIDKYVDKRAMQTLTYEKRKGYDVNTTKRFKEQLEKCGQDVCTAITGEKQEEMQL